MTLEVPVFPLTAADPLENYFRILGRYASAYKVPYWETQYEYRCLVVKRVGRLEEDRWVITDGEGHITWDWTTEKFCPGRHDGVTPEQWEAATVHPFAETFVLAERIAGEMRQEVTNQVAHAVARYEAGVDTPKETV